MQQARQPEPAAEADAGAGGDGDDGVVVPPDATVESITALCKQLATELDKAKGQVDVIAASHKPYIPTGPAASTSSPTSLSQKLCTHMHKQASRLWWG